MKQTFVERTLQGLLHTAEYAATAEQMGSGGGALQRVDPRVKVAGILCLILTAVASRRLAAIAGLFGIAVILALASRIPLGRMASWVWTPVLFFTGTIALPAVFLTPGPTAATWAGISLTEPGIRSAAFLIARAETAATLSTLLVLTTPWPWVLKALRTFRCPLVLVAILGMTYRYIFVILQTACDMFESRKSRTVGVLAPSDRRRLAASTAGVLLSKSIQLAGDVHLAMRSRGFQGEVHLLQEFRTAPADWWWLAGFAAIVCTAWRFSF
jgi:cobalt ECF transporter T component CbiQ